MKGKVIASIIALVIVIAGVLIAKELRERNAPSIPEHESEVVANTISISGKIQEGQILYEPLLGKCVVIYVDAENIMVGFYNIPRDNGYLPPSQSTLVMMLDQYGRYKDPIRPFTLQLWPSKYTNDWSKISNQYVIQPAMSKQDKILISKNMPALQQQFIEYAKSKH